MGDEIRFTRNDRDAGRKNGDRARVLEVDTSKMLAKVQIDTKAGPSVQTLDLGHQKHWEYSYCSTIFASQGQSVDQVLVHMDISSRTMGKEAWYVAISRGKNKATIFSDDVDRIPDAISRSMIGESALEALREREESLALEVGWGWIFEDEGRTPAAVERVEFLGQSWSGSGSVLNGRPKSIYTSSSQLLDSLFPQFGLDFWYNRHRRIEVWRRV